MNDKVVFLAHRKPELPTEVTEIIACKNCRNKTYKAVYCHGMQRFPSLQCVACGEALGFFGWITDEEAAL